MTKLKIAIVTGGDVAERSVSLNSAATVCKHLHDDKYDKYVIELTNGHFREQQTGDPVDMNDFSLRKNGITIHFDLIYLMLHGHPAEDGHLQGYFHLQGIPFTGSGVLCSALTFNKQACKDFLSDYGIPMAPSRLLRMGDEYTSNELLTMGLPLFVKPNKNGSSYGVSKVKVVEDLQPAIQKAFQFDDEILVESFLDGAEYSNGVLRREGKIEVLPVTEIVPQNEFFDFKAKYEHESQEITPARLNEEERQTCQAYSRRLYEVLNCRGICRFDYIKVGNTFYFLEANTIPGMSEASIVPQQLEAHGWTIGEALDAVITEALNRG